MRITVFNKKCVWIFCLTCVCALVVSATENQEMIEQVQTIFNDKSLTREENADAIEQLGTEGRNAFIHLVETNDYECLPHVAIYAAQDLRITELAPVILSKLGEPPNDYSGKSVMETLRVLKNSEVTPELIKIIRNEVWSRYEKWRTAHTLLILGSPGGAC